LNPMSRDLLATLATEFAGPPQIMLAVLGVLLAVAVVRGDRKARIVLLVLGLAQSCIDRGTVDALTLRTPRPEVLGIVALGLLVHGLSTRRSVSFVIGGVAAVIASHFAGLLRNPFASDMTVGAHAIIALLLVAGLAFDDRHARTWKVLSAALLLSAELAISAMHHQAPTVSLLYVAIVGAIGVSIARARRDVLFAMLAVASFLLLEANAAWLGVSVVETRLAWRGGPLLLASWVLLLGGLHVSAWKGGAATPVRRWLLAGVQ
jgi:hypothetical protein